MAIRRFALVVLDNKDRIFDRFNLDLVTNPSGLGFELNLSTISSDIEDIITKTIQKKNVIKMAVIHYMQPYAKSNVLTNWIQKYSTADYKMCLEYKDNSVVRYCEGKVTNLSKTELDEFYGLTQELTFTQTTPFFIKQENTITIQVSSVGKQYSYCYPYCYGASNIENNEINNPYILDIPIIITIDGALDNPSISLLDENGETYNQVRFDGISIVKGEQLIINSAQRKIYKKDITGKEVDFAPEVDPSYDTFLRAKSGLSKINVNTAESGDGFKLTGGWRQYTL